MPITPGVCAQLSELSICAHVMLYCSSCKGTVSHTCAMYMKVYFGMIILVSHKCNTKKLH